MNYPFESQNLSGNVVLNSIKDTGNGYGFGYKEKKENCNDIKYNTCSNYNVMFGSNKPLKEEKLGPIISGNLTYDPSTSCNNVWNNSTKRKIIVDSRNN